MKPQPWTQWLVNHNLKVIVYLIWLIILPLFLLVYLENAVEDANEELKSIQKIKKG